MGVFLLVFFFFNDTATTEIYTLSLHDALPISPAGVADLVGQTRRRSRAAPAGGLLRADVLRSVPRVPATSGLSHQDRKSTRLNSSHANISYAVFCLKKKKKIISTTTS